MAYGYEQPLWDASTPEPDGDVTVRTTVPLPMRAPDGTLCQATVTSFHGLPASAEHVLVVIGQPARDVPLVRLHSECLTGDVLGSARCDCGPQLQEAIGLMSRVGGVIVYLRQEGRGIGLYNKLDAYRLQDQGLDTYSANVALDFAEDARDFSVAAAMLRAVGITRCELLSNNPSKHAQLSAAGIDVVRCRPTGVHVTDANRRYLQAKREHAGHHLAGLDPVPTNRRPVAAVTPIGDTSRSREVS